jgi:micrococcal nuclease
MPADTLRIPLRSPSLIGGMGVALRRSLVDGLLPQWLFQGAGSVRAGVDVAVVSFARLPSLGALVLLVLGVVVLLLTGDSDESRDRRGRGGGVGERVSARVVSITDGDTIHVQIGDAEEKVRYIGIDTPESVIPGETPECFGKRAAHANAALVEGRTVTLVFGAERRDIYDRLLAYVYVGDEFVNAELVRRGFARTLTIAPNDDFADLLGRLEQAAGAAGRGLWGAC